MASSATKTVLVPLGNGTEEMEAVTIIDVLRRAGATVTVASVEPDLVVKCSRDVKIVADELIGQAADRQFDLIVLPVWSSSLRMYESPAGTGIHTMNLFDTCCAGWCPRL